MSQSTRQDAAEQFEPYRHDVYRWALRLLGHHHDALDVAQDVFIRWTGTHETTVHHPRSWLRRVTINRAIDVLRERRGTTLDRAGDLPQTNGAGTSESETDELRCAIAAALERLTEVQRSVLTAKVYDRQTFSQIAAEHGLALPTVKTHYLRALHRLRESLYPSWRPEGARP